MTIKLILSDETAKLDITIDKNVLSSKCKYFESMFTNFVEKNAEEININVPNIYVTHDILTSLGENNFDNVKHELKINKCLGSQKIDDYEYQIILMICLNYLSIDFDLACIIKDDMTSERFVELLDVFDMIGYNENVIKSLVKKLPNDFKLEIFSRLVDKINNVNCSDEVIELLETKIPKNFDLILIPEKIQERMVDLDKFMIACIEGRNINIYDSQGQLLNTITIKNEVYNNYIAFSPDGQKIAIRTKDNLKIHDVKTGKILRSIYDKIFRDGFNIPVIFKDNESVIYGLNFDLYLWNFEKNKLIRIEFGKNIIYSQDATKFAKQSDDRIEVYDIDTHYRLFGVKTIGRISHVALSTSGTLIAISEGDAFTLCHTFRLYDVSSKKLILKISDEDVRYSCFSLDNKKLAYCCDGFIKVWNIDKNELEMTIIDDNYVDFVKFSPKNHKIISWTQDENVTIWNAKTGQIIQKFEKQIRFPKTISGTLSTDLIAKYKIKG